MMMRDGNLRNTSEMKQVLDLFSINCWLKVFSLEKVWKEKYSVLAEENASLNDLIRVLQEVKFNVLCQKNLIKDVTTPSFRYHGALL